MISIIFSIFSVLYIRFLKIYKTPLNYKTPLKKKRSFEFNRKNLYKWMNLTKKERYNLSKSDSDNYLNKRKDLLDKIRKEYKTLKK